MHKYIFYDTAKKKTFELASNYDFNLQSKS